MGCTAKEWRLGTTRANGSQSIPGPHSRFLSPRYQRIVTHGKRGFYTHGLAHVFEAATFAFGSLWHLPPRYFGFQNTNARKLEARRGKKNLLEGSYARVSRIYCVILLQNLLQQEDKTSFSAFNTPPHPHQSFALLGHANILHPISNQGFGLGKIPSFGIGVPY